MWEEANTPQRRTRLGQDWENTNILVPVLKNIDVARIIDNWFRSL